MTYTTSGIYTWLGTNADGCDSTATLDLTINYSSSSTVTTTACDSYDWDGMTYDSTGMYTNMYTDVNGCDSTVTLDLTINNSSSSSESATACDSYDWNGATYTASGTYTWVGVNTAGCDSTVTLDLTINYSSSSTVTVSACDSYDWDGMTYDSTGMYTNVYTGVNGCDSTVTLDLTIHESPNDAQVVQNGNTLSVIVSTGTPPYSFLWNTNDTTQSMLPDTNGVYWCVVTDANGCQDWTNQYIYTSCDSLNDAQVVQNGDTLSVIVSTGTPPYSFLWNTNDTTQSIIPDTNGVYWCVVTDANGCQDWTNQYILTGTNINELNSSKLSIYPNPTKGLLNIEFDMVGSKEVSLFIINVLGDIVYQETIDNTIFKYTNKFDLANYSKGVYFVKLKKEDGVVTHKLILQ
jgi:hypothetical protein